MAHGAAVRITRATSVDYVQFAEPDAAAVSATRRIGDFETDARMLFCRVAGDRPVARVAIVDGTVVRRTGRRGFLLALPHRAPDVHLDFTADARIAGPSFGARLVVGGEEQPLERDRRAEPRE
jgi:hypothetical protein